MLHYARAHPDAIALGIDASADSLIDVSRKAGPNVAFLVADARSALTELQGRIDELQITLPWGSLLRRVLEGERAFALAVAGSL